jgi:GNAT superfamily N-acetyltransferase
MADDWMPRLELPLTAEQFRQLPRSPAYRYDHFQGTAWLNPRPRYYHALLALEPSAAPSDPPPGEPVPRRLRPGDWEMLPAVFAEAFRGQQPFGGLSDEVRLQAARKSLEHTRTGGDGPWIEQASFVAEIPDSGQALGAILITLLPDADPTDWDSYHWPEKPPEDCIARRMGRPHLTWIFVTNPAAGRGIGTALLRAAVRELLALGYTELASTFMLGNDSSMLWHWRSGFRLLAYPGSARCRP